MRDDTAERTLPGPTRCGHHEWLVSRYADVQAVLADGRFQIPQADADDRFGTVRWLRGSVSRFVNGPQHRRRRSLVERELAGLDPSVLREGTHRRALHDLGARTGRVDVMALLARRVPMATMAASLGVSDEEAAVEAVCAIAGGYFPGCSPDAELRADGGTARLAELLGSAGEDVIAARIATMVQGCDAIAGVIANTLLLVQEAPEHADGFPTEALIREVLRDRPPLLASRRVADEPAEIDGQHIAAGDTVVCSVEAANHDPEAFEAPHRFDPQRDGPESLTFGYGIRPCPGTAQAIMLAAGVVDAVRERCVLGPGAPVEYEPSSVLRIPKCLEVEIR